MIEQLFTLTFLLICGHALGDFAIQTTWVATNKNRHVRDNLSPEDRGRFQVIWPWLLTAHSLHHGLIVFLITQKIELAVAETAVHWVIDFGKTENWYGFHLDQILHVVTKFVWVALLYFQIV